MKNVNLKEDFENRVAINDLNNPDMIKGAIVEELNKKYVIDPETVVVIREHLGDIMFDIRTLDVELHNGPMYETTDILDISNEDLAKLIKSVLVSMPKDLFEAILITGKVKLFEQFHKL